MTRRPSSLLGVPRDRFPRLIGVWGALTSCRPSRLASVVPRLRGTTLCPLVRSDGCGALLPVGPGGLFSASSSRRSCVENDRTSQVPGVPLWKRAVLSSDSGGGADPSLPLTVRGRFCLAGTYKPWTPRHPIFRSSITRPTPLLSTLHGRPCDRISCKTRFWPAGSALTRRDFHPAGAPRTRLSRWHRFLPFLPSQASPGARRSKGYRTHIIGHVTRAQIALVPPLLTMPVAFDQRKTRALRFSTLKE